MNHDVKVDHPLDDDVLDAGCVGVCTGAVVTALSYRPRALLPPASHASLTAAPMLVAVAAARSSRSLYVVYAAYPCFICAKDGIVLMVHLRYVSGTMMRVWNGPNHGHHRPWRPPGREGLSSPCGAVWLFQLHFEQSRPAPGQHLHRQNRQKSSSPPKPEFPLFPIAQIPSVARLRIGRCPDRIVRVDKLELRSKLCRRDEWETREKVSFFHAGQSAPRRFAPNRIGRAMRDLCDPV